MEEPVIFYRYEAVQYASLGSDGDYVSSKIPNPKIVLRTYNLLKETSKGYWIGYGNLREGKLKSQGQWISKTATKRFANITKREALENFIKRSEKRAKILKYQESFSRSAINIAESMLNSLNKN